MASHAFIKCNPCAFRHLGIEAYKLPNAWEGYAMSATQPLTASEEDLLAP